VLSKKPDVAGNPDLRRRPQRSRRLGALGHFTAHGFQNLIGRTSTELDLCDAQATADFFAATRPDVVIHAATAVGGIAANASRPASFFSDNVRIQVNLFDSAVANGVERFLFLGSSCIYAKLAEQPIREDALLTGPLERTNEGFAMPTNLNGPGDNFNTRDSHVLSAMIRRFDHAVREGPHK
jgi:GDP-L-fucose synthase